MKPLKELNVYLWKIEKNIQKDLIEAQRKTAESICEDAKDLAPKNTGEYAKSIHVTETEVQGKNISTSIATDVIVANKMDNKEYNLGQLLEEGTGEHSIPNAFNWGVIYGFDSEMYKRTLTLDWHPGFSPIPHFQPALWLNVDVYWDNIEKVLDKEFK